MTIISGRENCRENCQGYNATFIWALKIEDNVGKPPLIVGTSYVDLSTAKSYI